MLTSQKSNPCLYTEDWFILMPQFAPAALGAVACTTLVSLLHCGSPKQKVEKLFHRCFSTGEILKIKFLTFENFDFRKWGHRSLGSSDRNHATDPKKQSAVLGIATAGAFHAKAEFTENGRSSSL